GSSRLYKSRYTGAGSRATGPGTASGLTYTRHPEESEMARGINKVILIGNAGGDPEVRYLPNGNAVANVTLATSDSWKDKQTGQQQERTEWHRVVFFGRLAEIVGEYVRKASKLYIEGRLQAREWRKGGGKGHTPGSVGGMEGAEAPLGRRGQGGGGGMAPRAQPPARSRPQGPATQKEQPAQSAQPQ